jgi:4-hydroxy-tetrahydrodipicolinate synthase
MFPRLYVDLYEAAVARDFDRIASLHNKVLRISSRFYTVGPGNSSYLKGIKCALSVMGICSDFMAEPLHCFGEGERKIIQGYLEETNVETKTQVSL